MLSVNKNKKVVKPVIFAKKVNDERVIPLNKVKNTLGVTTYYPPTNQEWSNSIYAYNEVNIKSIISAQKSLTALLESYFNMYFIKKILPIKKTGAIPKRLSTNKVLFSNAELKHTSDKVIITLYIYNEEKRTLFEKLKRLETIIFSINNKETVKDNNNFILSSSLKEKLNALKGEKPFLSLLKEICSSIYENILLEKNLLKLENLKKHLKDLKNIAISCEKSDVSLIHYENIYKKYINKLFLEKEIASIAYYKFLLSLNKHKFNDRFLSQLAIIISNIYNKKVEFNIINLKAIYLNSEIFTQAIALKLRNRKNRLLRVLRNFLHISKVSRVNSLKERFAHIDIKNLWANRVKNLSVGLLPSAITLDKINKSLNLLFANNTFIKNNKSLIVNNKYDSNIVLFNHILSLLKYKAIAGIRLEAKGRLTKRFTASRSVFKVKWKGSLKNLDSSYKGLSSVILRGHVKSNIQYSLINSKTRNGAFGIKGWISGK